MKITAHSGCDETPLNSLEYVKHAVRLPVDTLEIDIRRSKSGKLILTHDEAADGVSLAEAFSVIAPGTLCVNCDVKEYGLEEAVLETAAEAGISSDRILFSGSVTPHKAGEWPSQIRPEQIYLNIEALVPEVYNLNGQEKLDASLRAVKLCAETGCKVINVQFRICTPEFMACCAENGIGVSAWTPTAAAELWYIASMNPLNITSRNPMLAKYIASTFEK